MGEEKTGVRKVLGKGLGALIPMIETEPKPVSIEGRRLLEMKPIEDLEPGRYQPRKNFDEEGLRELAQSIKEHGIVQPLVVKRKSGRIFEIVIGERRWRAAQAAGLREVPVIITDVSDAESLELALVENLQRHDLNPLEEAMGYNRLMVEFSMTQEAVATRVGKDRSTVANAVRLLALPEKIREHLAAGDLTVGHARALLALASDAERLRLCREIIEKHLTVRQVESLVRGKKPGLAPIKQVSVQIKSVSEELQRRFKTKVKILDKGKKGSIVLEYYSPEELDRLVQILLG